MLSVKDNINTIVIKNSRFICLLYQVNNIEEVNNYLDKARDDYKDATHYCYAYIIGSVSKYSDDGEPIGTAGNPMLEVLKKNNLNNVLCIVIRYFGKILLGASGLVRAYTRSVSECLDGHIKELIPGYNIIITFNYDNIKEIDYILKDINIIDKKFDTNVIYNINVDIDTYNKLKNINNCNIKKVKDIYL